MKRANFFGTKSGTRFFKRTTYQLALAAVFTAMTLVSTMVLTVPVPATGGYVNVGDTMIFVSAALFGPFVGGIAGGLGSMLADLILGYAFYAPFTFIIKGLEGVLCGFLGFVLTKKIRKTAAKYGVQFASFVLSGLLMVTGYFVVEYAYYGIGGAVAAVTGNLIQAFCSVALASVLLFLCKLGERVVKSKLPQNVRKTKPSDSIKEEDHSATEKSASVVETSDSEPPLPSSAVEAPIEDGEKTV